MTRSCRCSSEAIRKTHCYFASYLDSVADTRVRSRATLAFMIAGSKKGWGVFCEENVMTFVPMLVEGPGKGEKPTAI